MGLYGHVQEFERGDDPKMMGRVDTIVLGGRNPHIFGTIYEDQDDGIMQLR